MEQKKEIRKSSPARLRWSGMLKVEEIQLRKSRWGGVYALLYTNAKTSVVATEKQASLMCLFEPYEMYGEIKMYHGGVYLRLSKASIFNSAGYRDTIC